jgi:hypothetical protein
MRRRGHNLRDGWIWVIFSSSLLLHRRWEVTSPAKPRKCNKQCFLFCFLLLRSAPGLLFSPCFFVLSFFRWQTWRWGRSARGRSCGCSRAWRRSCCGVGFAAGGRRLADLWCVEGQSWSSVCGAGQVREADGSTERGEGRRWEEGKMGTAVVCWAEIYERCNGGVLGNGKRPAALAKFWWGRKWKGEGLCARTGVAAFWRGRAAARRTRSQRREEKNWAEGGHQFFFFFRVGG